MFFRVCVCVCVCVCVRERERERVTSQHISYLNCGLCVCFLGCVCVCVWERERERERRRHGPTAAAYVQTHTSFITVSVTWLCSTLRLELMLKLRTLLTVFTFILKAEARDYGTFPTHACGVQPITMCWVSWPIRADSARRKEGLCRKRSVWERRCTK